MAIQDPHQGDMEKRLLLAMALSVAVLLLSQYFYSELYPPQPPPPQPPVQEEPPPRAVEPPVAVPPGELLPGPSTSGTERTLEVENEHLILRWSSKGGVLESVRLKDLPPGSEPLEIIPQELSENIARPLDIRVGDDLLDQRLAAAVYEVEGASADHLRAPAEIVFRYRDEALEAVRRVRVPASGYILELESEVRTARGPIPHSIRLGPGVGNATPSTQGDFANPQVAIYSAGTVERHAAADLEGTTPPIAAGARWVALDSQYFACLVFDPAGLGPGRVLATEFRADPDEEAALLIGAEVGLESGTPHAVFVGPKDYQVLQGVNPTVSQLIDFGFFAFLVKPLLLCLKFIHYYIQDYAWAIIILTFIINLALFPVRYKQMVSMKKMAQVQPQMKAVQDKYKRMKRDDPRRQKMNEEVMALYKKHGVNPLGGCLPLLIQMPFLFAFYSMLYSSIELRGAPFAWIGDLSRPDIPLTVVMGLSMVLQQKMTPAAGDPTQRRVMMLLPVFFTFLFFSFSSGLVLYFLFSNLFGMMLQFLLQKWSPELAPAKAGKRGSAPKRAKKRDHAA